MKLKRGKGGFFMKNSKGQVTIFIIIAILIVVGALIYFFLRGSMTETAIPAQMEPVYANFLACLDGATTTGISVLNSQGGYIYLPEFEPGSSYMPFSSQLNFLGNPVPYWYYVSGNNLEKEQVPTKRMMEDQLSAFIEQKINNCDFTSYYSEGFEISLTEPKSKVTIKEDKVEISLDAPLRIVKNEESVLVRNHKVTVRSKLGSLYDSAKKVYDNQQETLFLEEYGLDVLWNYAPVDGAEITCSPLIWKADEVFDELQEAIEVNTFALTTKSARDDYFFVDIPVKEEVRFLNSKNWPNTFEVSPAEGNILLSTPVGNQPGLGILGFCYVPYHFVYDLKYPVMIQVQSGDEIFQFPMAVIIQGNNPREPLDAEAVEEADLDLCKYKNTQITVKVIDKKNNPIEADISFGCFANKCNIGKTSDAGMLVENFPQCVNGYVSARASGFKETRYLFSTVSSGSVNIIMEKLYSKGIQLKLDRVNYNGNAIIYFISEDSTKTLVYPEQRIAELGEGQYEIQVYIFQNSSINLEGMTTEQCLDVPRAGILGVLGLKHERCFEIEIPEQTISQVLSGGGTQNYYVLESELMRPGYIEISTESISKPENLEQLQNNHLLFEAKSLEIKFL